jgi:hypothetical protein
VTFTVIVIGSVITAARRLPSPIPIAVRILVRDVIVVFFLNAQVRTQNFSRGEGRLTLMLYKIYV